MRWWMPFLIVVGCVSAVAWLYGTANTLRTNVAAGIVLLGVVLLGIWYVFFTGLPWRRRFALAGLGLLGLGLLFVAGTRLLRYEGSADGTALPRFTWRWAPERGYDLPALDAPSVLAAQGAEGSSAAVEPVPGARDFPRFLGPAADGIVPGIALDPDWAARPPTLVWRREVGPGWSGFAIAGNRAVTQEQRGDNEIVSCYDLLTGNPVWAHRNPARFDEKMGGVGPRSTPTIHDGRVYAQGATGILDCLDLATGAPIWSRRVLDEHASGNIEWGKSNAPLIVADLDLVVVTGGRQGPGLVAYRASDGAPAWTAAAEETASYSSPVLAELAGRRQLVCVHQQGATGHEPATGALLWRFEWPGQWPKAAQPVAVGTDRLLLCASYGIPQILIEVAPPVAGEADQFTVRRVWESNRLKTKFSSPCVAGSHAWGLDEGRLACIDLATGDRVWKDGRYGFGQNLLVGDVLLIQAEQGDVVLAAADPAGFRELARLEALDGKTWNPPALAGAFLLVRNDSEAACFRLPLR